MAEDRDPVLDSLISELNLLQGQLTKKTEELSQAIASNEDTDSRPEWVSVLAREADALRKVFGERVDDLQRIIGISDEELEEIERLATRGRNDQEPRYMRRDVEEVAPTAYLPDEVLTGFERLIPLISADWLRMEAPQRRQLGTDFRNDPFHLVAGTVFRDTADPGPQRFADMLLTSEDFLAGRDDYDYYAAPTLLAEVAALGSNLEQIDQLGSESATKLKALPLLSNADVASTIHELLVGASFVRRGLDAECVPTIPGRKSPDLRLTQSHVPISMECKRRLGLGVYEQNEARAVSNFFQVVKQRLQERSLCLEATFTDELSQVPIDVFLDGVNELLSRREGSPLVRAWGILRCHSLPPVVDVLPTKLYSPNFLQKVFGWSALEAMWDGIACQVDPPEELTVNIARHPHCLKWSSVSDTAITKKARGVTSLWAAAGDQIPAGHMGLIYIAYAEGGRPFIADTRTSYIIETAVKWHHRWQVNLPFTVVGRLYGRPLGNGSPDFIENSMRMASPWAEDTSEEWPADVFTPDWG